jgi:hypothetical protein
MKRIGVHVHMSPEFYRQALGDAGMVSTAGTSVDWTPELALQQMDAHGIATSILSISFPGVHFGDDAAARALARRCNELAADLGGRWPRRFGGFAVLPRPATRSIRCSSTAWCCSPATPASSSATSRSSR